MLETTILGPDDATSVAHLLDDIGNGSGVPGDIRAAALFWSTEVSAEMDRVDLQTVAWLLRDASAQRRVASASRDQARYWAAYIEGRMTR